ncbi:MAG: VWA domain-containing protein, partial [Candidatus Kapabacteria bacterium]|nr:VWA domain-containing protein [Candidatus Kapabacteria bacterium]
MILTPRSIRTCVVLLYSLFFTTTLVSQQFTILDIDVTRFPTLSARLIALDTTLNLSAFSAKDITVRENGYKTSLLGISSASRTPDSAQSVVFAVDMASSMAVRPGRIPFLKKFIQSVVQNLSHDGCEFAVVLFDNEPIVAQSLTSDRYRVGTALDSIVPLRGTSYQPLFTHPKNGIFSLLEKSKKKKTVIIVSDGYTNENLDEIRSEVQKRSITVHTVMLEQPNMPQLRAISDATRGASLDILEADQSAERIAASLSNYMRGYSPLTVTWNALSLCNPAKRADIEITPLLTTHGVRYNVPDSLVPDLQPTTNDVSFGAVAKGITATSTIQIYSTKTALTIDSLRIAGSPVFRCITAFPATITPDKPLSVEITCTPTDSAFTYAELTLFSSRCKNVAIAVSCGFPGIPPQKQSLRVVQPNGGEILTTNNMYTIQWEGMPPLHYSRVELSTDNGKSWQQLAENIQGNSYQWQIKGTGSKECLIRVRHKYTNDDGATKFMQTDVSDAPFTIQA